MQQGTGLNSSDRPFYSAGRKPCFVRGIAFEFQADPLLGANVALLICDGYGIKPHMDSEPRESLARDRL